MHVPNVLRLLLPPLLAACGSVAAATRDGGPDSSDARVPDTSDAPGPATGDASGPDSPDASDAPQCSYPPANNDSRCPPSYSFSYYRQTCSPVGLTCAYPGQGDGMSNGCFSTAMMWCYADNDAAAGSGTWTVAQ